MMQEDAILVQQTLAGDEQAFHRLIIKYYATIYALILSWVKNPEDAKDLTQEAYLKAYQELHSLRQPEQFRLWLQRIAKNQCQDWLRKQKIYDQLDENMVCQTPSADELLILRETLAKVMKAIDELPESESQLLKDRYLDDVSYDDLEAKHGLSQSALAMRLLRAKQHVRDKMKVLSSLWILSWRDVAKKIFVGGIEAMKISAKVKFIAIGVAAVLILGGTGVIVWHYQQLSQEATSDSSTNQTIQKASLSSDNNQLSANNKTISDDNASKLAENQSLDAENGKTSGQMIASGTGLSGTDNSNIDPKLAKKIEVYSGLMRLLPEYKQAKQSAENISEEMRSQLNSDFLDRSHFPEIHERRYGPDGIKVFTKQGKEITDNPEINSFVESIYKKQEEIRTLAVKIKSLLQEIDDLCPREVFEGWTNETPPRRITGVVSWAPTGDYGSIDEYRLAKWLGKEPPWDGGTDYKNAKDFTQ